MALRYRHRSWWKRLSFDAWLVLLGTWSSRLIQERRVVFMHFFFYRLVSEGVLLIHYAVRKVLKIRFVPLNSLKILNGYIIAINILCLGFLAWVGFSTVVSAINRLTHIQLALINATPGAVFDFLKNIGSPELVWCWKLMLWALTVRDFTLANLIGIVWGLSLV